MSHYHLRNNPCVVRLTAELGYILHAGCCPTVPSEVIGSMKLFLCPGLYPCLLPLCFKKLFYIVDKKSISCMNLFETR
jgi:hypothetical protein